MAHNEREALSPVGFEHLRVNVADKVATAQWYVDNFGLEVVPSGNKDLVCVADKDENFKFEFSSIPNIRNVYSDLHVDSIHVAIEGHQSFQKMAEKLQASCASQQVKMCRNAVGDEMLFARDPNGLFIELIHRVSPFCASPVKGATRFEHLALNTPNQMISALWYVEFMNLVIPWSKDIDAKANNFRDYRVPYVGDVARKMSFEFYDKTGSDYSFSKFSHEECHIAFTTHDPEKLAERMVFGGAKVVSPLRTGLNGDQFIDLVDPRNFPIRLIKRKEAVL